MLNKNKILLLGLMLIIAILLLGMSNTPPEKEIIKTRQELAGKELKLEMLEFQEGEPILNFVFAQNFAEFD
ncbi:hypothetical protein [Halanaerobacter jeridensis]|uniref:Uncharacterized protein n=1 Tax=Halanaerobacter jeridensis TaxID=706427 RepID=A0A938XU16_9FIRM|nr:hypothetical protein [Halanaerobacter jeridensis]MBM7556316.1 hypothetical protein [Halanaerobacter jeridensis]